MPIIKYKPITNARRNMSVLDYKHEITKKTPEKSLLRKLVKKSGRNNYGHITVRHKGGGVKRQYRLIDFKRDKVDIKGKVDSIQYDPNRSANIALIHYLDGEKRYILAPKGLKVGNEIIAGKEADILVGNCMQLANIPEGTFVHNVELKPGRGGQLARSAGAKIQVLGKDESGRYVIVKMVSKETRKILAVCKATIGVIGNEDQSLVNIGKAGRNRHKGIRPTVRGSVMNPNDHPHGGGEGKAPIGRKAPMTPWGKKALGVKTRNQKKASSKLIIRSRKGK